MKLKGIFLAAALALPSSEFSHPHLSLSDVKVIHFITRLSKDPFYKTRSSGKRMILIGLPDQWLEGMSAVGFLVWRIQRVHSHKYDIEASVLEQPIKRESVHVVIYGDGHGHSAWGAMMILRQSLFGLIRGGYFIFNPIQCFRWTSYLEQWGYIRLPFRWHEMDIWQKSERHYRHTLTIMA